jgi:hypothetical protein
MAYFNTRARLGDDQLPINSNRRRKGITGNDGNKGISYWQCCSMSDIGGLHEGGGERQIRTRAGANEMRIRCFQVRAGRDRADGG